MNKDFEYNGFATDWIGFKFRHDDLLYIVIAEINFREYQVTYKGRLATDPVLSASQYDLMNEYILQLEDKLAEIGQHGMERSEY